MEGHSSYVWLSGNASGWLFGYDKRQLVKQYITQDLSKLAKSLNIDVLLSGVKMKS